MKVIIYIRKSTEQEDRQILSMESQLRELREFAAREHVEIVASLREAKTAKSPGRTEFARMLDMIEKGDADGILAWHPDRLARNAIDGGKIIHLLDSGKLKHLFFPTMTFDNTPQGKFMLMIAFGQSKLYVDNLSENVKRGIRQKLKRGEWSWFAPTGYLNDPKTRNIVPDPEKAPLVRKVFELYATGDYTLDAIKDFLKRKGLRSSYEKIMGKAAVQKMLQNPLFCGLMRVNGELHEGSFKPLISKDLFDECQRVMQNRSKPHRRRKHEFPFSGWLKCAECGCAITAQKQKGHHYYHCTKKKGPCPRKHYVREEAILEEARMIVEQLVLPDDWAEKMLKKIDREETKLSSDHRATVQHLEEEMQDIEKQLETLLDLRLQGDLTSEEYLAKKNKLISHKVEIEQKIVRAEQNHGEWLELSRELILASREAKSLLTTENYSEIPTFLKTAGLNFLLKGSAVQWQAKTGWQQVAASPESRNWWAREDLNRRPPVYKSGALT